MGKLGRWQPKQPSIDRIRFIFLLAYQYFGTVVGCTLGHTLNFNITCTFQIHQH